MRALRRRILRWMFLVFLAVVILVSLASVGLRHALDSDWLRSEITEQVSAETGREVGLGQATVSLFSGLVIKDFFMMEPSAEDAETFNCAKAVMDVNLLGLLDQRLEVDTLRVIAPHLEVVVAEDGTTNIADILERMTSQSSSDATGFIDALHSIQVQNGSISFLREDTDLRRDPYLDLTALNLELVDPTVGSPFPIRLSGNISAARQTAFRFEGELNLQERSIDGVVSIAVLRPSLINDLLRFSGTERWEFMRGTLEEIEIHISSGPGFTNWNVNADGELLDIALRLPNLGLFCLEGGAEMRASFRDEVHLARLRFENIRDEENGVIRMAGTIDPSEGQMDLDIEIEGLGEENFESIVASAFVPQGDNLWVDFVGDLLMADGFREGQLQGRLEAKRLEVAMPVVSTQALRLDGLTITGSVGMNLASRELGEIDTVWTLPGLIPEGDPVALVGDAGTSLGVDLMAIDTTAMGNRLVPAARSMEGIWGVDDVRRHQTRTRAVLPIGFRLPSLTTASHRWSDLSGTLILTQIGAALENVAGRVDGGGFEYSGAIHRWERRGEMSVNDVPLESLHQMWRKVLEPFEGGAVTGDLAGKGDTRGGISVAALDCQIAGTDLTDHWALNALADFTGNAALRDWSDAEVTVLAALDANAWHIERVRLRDADSEVEIAGRLWHDSTMLLVAKTSLPLAAAGSVTNVLMEGSIGAPRLQEISEDHAMRVLNLESPEALVNMFAEFGLETPTDLRERMVSQPTVAPEPRPTPVVEPNLPPTPRPEEVTPLVPQLPEPTEPSERPSEIVE